MSLFHNSFYFPLQILFSLSDHSIIRINMESKATIYKIGKERIFFPDILDRATLNELLSIEAFTLPEVLDLMYDFVS